MSKKKYNSVPGRGLLTKPAINDRKEHLLTLGYSVDHIEKTGISYTAIQNNIESLIGSVEIPTGLVGPILYCESNGSEEVFCAASTLEGALVASMNRGAKAISLSGGFNTKTIHQKMVRSPLFILSEEENAIHFENWIKENFEEIKRVSEMYSNHATLLEIASHQEKNNVHLNFVYTTGDAAGQNMTTTCTWHAVLWIVDEYAIQGNERIDEYVLEGNGSSDKKVSNYLIEQGRGIRVEAHAIIDESVIHKILRTSSGKLLKFYGPSRRYAEINGMLGYSINAANAIAAIFSATGQDLASIPESSIVELTLQKHPKGLELHLIMHGLVIGTLGGGTHLPKQKEALQLMKCYGANKIERFASLIAGFTLGLELSTYAAMVSGEFAKAHEKLGRNKPKDWLQWNEINPDFIRSVLNSSVDDRSSKISISDSDVDNGILMNLCKRVNRKPIGFIPVNIETQSGKEELLLKSKATDIETIKGIHIMAASIDTQLCDLITDHKDHLEYRGCHIKELLIPQFLHHNELRYAPKYYNHYINESREIYILAQERLIKNQLELLDSENSPELWTEKHIKNTINAISSIHLKFLDPDAVDKPLELYEFKVSSSIPLYKKLIQVVKSDEDKHADKFEVLQEYLEYIIEHESELDIPKTLVHNDFNPRNIAVRKSGEVCIYDWELAVLNYPHRDVIELLSFTLPNEFDQVELMKYLKYHYEAEGIKLGLDWGVWKSAYIYTLKEYLLTRVLFYTSAQVVMKLKFVDRIYTNCITMINLLENE